MRTVRLAATALCAAGLVATATPALAATAAPTTAPSSTAADCHIRFYFNQNSYVYLRANDSSTILGLAYANDTFIDKNQSSNGFRYGTDGRSGGKTGWVRSANITAQKVCDA